MIGEKTTMARHIDPEKHLLKPFVYEQQALPIDKPVAQYIRQSTDGQVKHNIQSLILQDEEMGVRLSTVGFGSIIKIDIDQGLSGQKRRDERKGLDHIYTLAETGQIGAVAAYDASRFYRDTTHVWYNDFIQLLITYNIPAILYDEEQGIRVFWPNRQQDMDALREEFKQAAFYLRHIYGKVLPAKMKAIESGSFGGHLVPMGFIVVGEKGHRHYQPYMPHATLIVYLYKRYRELNGNLARLGRELQATGFAFPAFGGVEKIPPVALKFKNGAYPCHSREALISILTNVAYIGWYLFNGVIVSKEAHEPIVSMDDFLYAYNRLSPITLDGTPNEHKPPLNRRYTNTPALVENILTNGENKCYAMSTTKSYIAREMVGKWNSTTLTVPIYLLDMAVTTAILEVVTTIDMRHHQGLQDSLYAQIQSLVQEKAAEGTKLSTAVENIDLALKGWELDKQSCRDTGNKNGLDEANRQLKKLHDARAALVQKATDAERERTALEETQALHMHVASEWFTMPFERQQRFVTLLIQSLDMVQVSPHLLALTLVFKPPVGITLHGFLFRKHGERVAWTDAELSFIKDFYPSADRLDILKALPNRTWEAIKFQATTLGLQRLTRKNTSNISVHHTYTDHQIMQKAREEWQFYNLIHFVDVWQPFDAALLESIHKQLSGL